MGFEFKKVYSGKYLAGILSLLIGIAAVVFGVSQAFVSCDTPENEMAESYVGPGEPFTEGPTSPPYVEPPTSPPPGSAGSGSADGAGGSGDSASDGASDSGGSGDSDG